MLFSANTSYIGIDPTAGQKPFVYAALDQDLSLLALAHCHLDEVLAFTAGQRQAVVAICGPRAPNLGLLTRSAVRQSLDPPPRPGRWHGFRVAEYILRTHNISVPQTPARAEDCPNWMRMSFTLFRKLEQIDYASYPASQAASQMLEVYPFASYAALLDQLPLPKYTLEGRLQRQLALYEQKIKVPDPMRFFEEITRHRLLKGILPVETLYSPGELDALVAAYTAWKAALHPQEVSLVGEAEEGQIVIPISRLSVRYANLPSERPILSQYARSAP